MPILRELFALIVLLACATAGFARGTLWLGDSRPGGSVSETKTDGGVLDTIRNLPLSGIAFDGAFLYFGNSHGNISKRTADGSTQLGSFTVAPKPGLASQDLAWDSKRQRLWRIDSTAGLENSDNNVLVRIDPASGKADASYTIPHINPTPQLTSAEGQGVAYDSRRDLLYISFEADASGNDAVKGVVLAVNPETGAIINALFQTDYKIFGLAYDPESDSLWSGGDTTARNQTLNGQLLSSFAHPQGEIRAEGLEFITELGVVEGCRVEPRNASLTLHRQSYHLTDPSRHPLHTVKVEVFSNGSAASGVVVTLTATQPVFTSSPSQAPTQTAATATTDGTGLATFSFDPPSSNTFDQTDFVATGAVGGQAFRCQGSVTVGIGTSSAGLVAFEDSQVAHALLQRFEERLIAAGEMFAIDPRTSAFAQTEKEEHQSLIRKILDRQPALQEADLHEIETLIERYEAGSDPALRKILAGLKEDIARARSLPSMAAVRDSSRTQRSPQSDRRTEGIAGAAAPVAARARIQSDYGDSPLSFELNQGQVDGHVHYLARGPGYSVYLTPREALLVDPPRLLLPGSTVPNLRMVLASANPSPRMVGLEELRGRSHYFTGNDPKLWRTSVPRYARVKYEAVYPGVDLVFRGTHRQVEFDFIVAPGASPKKIALTFQGADRIEVEPRGDVILHRPAGSVRLRTPGVYQEIAGVPHPVSARYVLRDGNRVGFEIENYDERRPLIIDPVLSYSSFAGGASDEFGMAVAVDAQGNAYITGATSSANFPITGPAGAGTKGMDVFVTKLNASGSAEIYSTYIGGTGSDAGLAIAVDSSGSAYVTGVTTSTNFPLTQSAQHAFGGGVPPFAADAFVFKLNPAGSALVHSTYLGGSGGDVGKGIAVDAAGNAYVAGFTSSTNFPTKNALQPTNKGGQTLGVDSFVVKLNAAGSDFVYATYLGGRDDDLANAIAIDSSGNAYVTGMTKSNDLPTTANALLRSYRKGLDGFVAKLDANGQTLLYSTYLGGESDDFGTGIAVDSSGHAYVTGATGSKDFPVAHPAQLAFGASNSLGVDAFVSKLEADGSALVYSTFLGGGGTDLGWAIAVGPDGSAYVAGETNSINFPASNGLQAATAGLNESFVAKLNPAGSAFLYATQLGGTSHDAATGIALDGAGNAYLTGSTTSVDFPVTYGAFQTTAQGATDALVMKIVEGTASPRLATLSAAGFQVGGAASPVSIVSSFGTALASGIAPATAVPLPTILAGSSVTVKDSAGAVRLAPLFYASPSQINYVIPAGTVNGLAEVTVSGGNQVLATGTIRIESLAPALFSANDSGQGVAAAYSLRTSGGIQIAQLIFQCGTAPGNCVATPVDLGAASDQVFLMLFGTGMRGLSSLSAAGATVGGQSVPIASAGVEDQDLGLDQVTLGPLPHSLQGRGEVNIGLTVDGKAANTVTVSIK